eukprot:GHVN01051484.1.p1 GENE.GHVN01051484.1~~GHVN01051484.1.p1  ORF type:complete len:174 (+),score=53.62 GHVN01051484.1:926-1447(+)
MLLGMIGSLIDRIVWVLVTNSAFDSTKLIDDEVCEAMEVLEKAVGACEDAVDTGVLMRWRSRVAVLGRCLSVYDAIRSRVLTEEEKIEEEELSKLDEAVQGKEGEDTDDSQKAHIEEQRGDEAHGVGVLNQPNDKKIVVPCKTSIGMKLNEVDGDNKRHLNQLLKWCCTIKVS